jgi:hypothetical protein
MAAADPTRASTPELARHALTDLGELVRREVQLARDELRRDVGRAVVPTVMIAAGAGLAWAGAGLCLQAAAVLHPRRAGVYGAALSLLGLATAAVGWWAFPRRPPLVETRARLEADARAAREASTEREEGAAGPRPDRET